MALVIRAGTADDGDAIRVVSDRAFSTVRHIYQPNPVALANLSRLVPALECLIAQNEGTPAGVVRFASENDVVRVIGLAVLPEHRRRGIARSLIERLAEIAFERGCRALVLHTVVQTGNVEIFERLGFRFVEEQPDEYSVSPTSELLTEAYMERACAAKL